MRFITDRAPEKLGAVLFDMDGLLVDSERLAQRNCFEVGRELGYPLTEAVTLQQLGCTHERCVEILSAAVPNFDEALYFARVRERMNSVFRAELTERPGASSLLMWLREKRIPYALASSSAKDRVALSLEVTGLDAFFDEARRVTGEQALRSKPAPDLFLAAAARLGVPPERCLVLEDSPNGVRAGRAAGAYVCMVPDLIPFGPELAPYCDAVAESLREVPELLSARR